MSLSTHCNNPNPIHMEIIRGKYSWTQCFDAMVEWVNSRNYQPENIVDMNVHIGGGVKNGKGDGVGFISYKEGEFPREYVLRHEFERHPVGFNNLINPCCEIARKHTRIAGTGFTVGSGVKDVVVVVFFWEETGFKLNRNHFDNNVHCGLEIIRGNYSWPQCFDAMCAWVNDRHYQPENIVDLSVHIGGGVKDGKGDGVGFITFKEGDFGNKYILREEHKRVEVGFNNLIAPLQEIQAKHNRIASVGYTVGSGVKDVVVVVFYWDQILPTHDENRHDCQVVIIRDNYSWPQCFEAIVNWVNERGYQPENIVDINAHIGGGVKDGKGDGVGFITYKEGEYHHRYQLAYDIRRVDPKFDNLVAPLCEMANGCERCAYTVCTVGSGVKDVVVGNFHWVHR